MSMVMMMAAVHKHETTSIHDSRGQLRMGRDGIRITVDLDVWLGFVL